MPPAARTVDIHPEARVEALAQIEWFFERSPLAAAAFEAEVARALEFLASQPESCPPHLFGTHRYIIERFSYDVVFKLYPHRITVVAFASQRRRPGYWAKRR